MKTNTTIQIPKAPPPPPPGASKPAGEAPVAPAATAGEVPVAPAATAGGVAPPDTAGETSAAPDAAAAPEQAEGQEQEQQEQGPPSLLDRLFGGAGDLPAWAAEFVAEQEESGEFTLSDADIEALPIRAKQLIATAIFRGRQAKAQFDQERQAQEAAAKMAEKRLVDAKRSEADAFKWARDAKLRELAEQEVEGQPPDPNSPEGITYLAVQAAKKEIRAFWEEIQAADQRVTAAAAAAEKAAADDARRAEVAAFIEAHSEDFQVPKIRDAIVDIVKRSNGQITAEEAHQLVMGRMALETQADRAEALAAARRRVAPGGGRGGTVIPEMPSHIQGNTEAEIAWYQQHPDALARDTERSRRRLAGRR